MSMYRIVCTRCKWTTSVRRLVTDCVKQAEHDWYLTHVSGCLAEPQAHEDAFELCPICGHKYRIIHRFFPQEQIEEIETDRERKLRAIKAKQDADPAFREACRRAYESQSAGALVYKYFPELEPERRTET